MVHEEKLSSVLSELARTMITDFPIQRILDHLVERVVGVLPVTSVGVTLISPGKPPEYIAASDDAALQFERLQTDIWEGPCLASFNLGEAVSVPDVSASCDRFPRLAPAAAEAGLAAVFAFPMRHGDGRLGALNLYRDTVGMLDEHDMEVAQTLADVAAAYVLNARRRDEARTALARAEHSALHDPLTGLPNRALLQERLFHAAQRAQRTRTNAAVFFADLDRFKQVNDTYGHRVGDELLCAVGHRLAAFVRPGDTLARFSGDEFVFLFEELQDPSDVEVLVSRIADAFEAPFLLPTTAHTMTVSVGVAFAGPGQDISEQLVDRADSAMYYAKERGGAGHHILDLYDAAGR